MTIAELLRTTPWTQTSLAQATGFTQSYISKLLADPSRPDGRTCSLDFALSVEIHTCRQVRAEHCPLSAEDRKLLRQIRRRRSTRQGPRRERRTRRR
jgi:hypothetical protein